MADLFRIGCEYDYGQDEVIFSSREKAEKWLCEQIQSVEGDDAEWDFDVMRANNLIWIEAISLDPTTEV